MRHMKEWKINLFTAERYQTDDGSWRTGYVNKGAFWANVKPVAMTANYTNTAVYDVAEFIVTVNKPSSFELTPDMYTIWGDRVLKSTRVEDVEGKTRGDVRIYFKTDSTLDAGALLAKVKTDDSTT